MKKLSKLIALVLSVLMLMSALPFTSFALGTSGNLSSSVKWSVSSGTLSITGTGTVCSYAYTKWSTYASAIKQVKIEEGITAIDTYAFAGQKNIQAVSLPNSLKTIGNYAFTQCTNLCYINFSNIESIGNNAFSGCLYLSPTSYYTVGTCTLKSMSNAIRLDYLTNIGDYAFSGCAYGLKYFISRKSGSISVGTNAFSDCISLEEVSLYEKNITIGENAFVGCTGLTYATLVDSSSSGYKKGESLNLGKNAFNGCTQLATVNIYSYNANLGESAFSGCQALSKVDWNYDILTVGDTAFGNCTGIKNLAFCNGSATIGARAFYNCSALESVTFAEGITAIGAEAFRNCSKLKAITIPSSVSNVGDYAFAGCSACTSLSVASGATGFGGYSFTGLAITDVTIPASVGKISSNMFAECRNLKTVTINNGVSAIGEGVFRNCTALTDVKIYSSVKNIDSSAFCKTDSDSTVNLTGLTIHCEKGSEAESFAKAKGFNYVTDLYVQADSCGENLTYIFYGSGLLEISGTGAMTDYAAGSTPWESRKAAIKSVIINEGVTSIGSNAFNGFSNISSYSLPSTLESIGKYAMEGNYSLTAITLPENLKTIGERAFEHCELRSISIPDSVTSIGVCAFRCNEWHLTSAKLPADMKTIPASLFQECYALTDVTFPENVERIESNAFLFSHFKTLNIPNTVKYIGESAFRQNQVTNLVIPDSVTYIGYSAFSQNDYLKTVKLSANLEAIPAELFYHCDNLTSVEVPSSVKSIGDSAFHSCLNLESVTLPDSYITLGDGIFTNTALIKDSSKRENGVLYIGKYLIDADDTLTGEYTVKDGTICIYNNAFDSCTGLTSVKLPDSLYEICKYAFRGCSALTSINIPKAVAKIGTDAFASCSAVESITVSSENTVYDSRENCNAIIRTSDSALVAGCMNTLIPMTVRSIESRAFYGVSGMTWCYIPESVTSVGDYAFFDCVNLTGIAPPNSLSSIGEKAFGYYTDNSSSEPTTAKVSSLTLYVRLCEAAKTYATSNGFTCEELWTLIDSGKCGDNLMWYYYEEGVLEINGTGEMYDWNSDYPDWYDYQGSIGEIIVDEGVTSIGDYAFYSLITEYVYLPSTLTEIGEGAFMYNFYLKSVIISDGPETIGECAFYLCSALTEITIPDSVRTIGKEAFRHCQKLETVNLPSKITMLWPDAFYETPFFANNYETVDGVTYLGEYVLQVDESLSVCKIREGTKVLLSGALSDCYCLTSLDLPDGLVTIGEAIFGLGGPIETISLPDSVTYIADRAFQGCSQLEYCDIGDGVTYIGEGAFLNCKSLTTFEMPDTVEYIGDGAFFGCSALESVTLSNKINRIGEYTFNGCVSLTSVEIPDKVTEIGKNAFYKCKKLKSVNLPSTLKQIGEETFFNCISLTSIDIPDSVEKIDNRAFYGCSALTSLKIGSGTKEIGGGAFSGCDSLTSLDIPDNVQKIASSAFAACSKLKSINIGSGLKTLDDGSFGDSPAVEKISISKDNTALYTQEDCNAIIRKSDNTLIFGCKNTQIPEGVKVIAEYAFDNTPGLEAITIPGSVEKIGDYAFYRCDNLKSVTVPATVTSIGEYAFGFTSSDENNDPEVNIYDDGDSDSDSTEAVTNQKAVNDSENIKVNSVTDGENINVTQTIAGEMINAIPVTAYSVQNGDDSDGEEAEAKPEVKEPQEYTAEDDSDSDDSDAEEQTAEPSTYRIEQVADFVMYGYKGSAAQTYANDNEIAFKIICSHTGTLSKVDAVAATCTLEGNVEYYVCSYCERLFTDETAETETTLFDVAVARIASTVLSETALTYNGSVQHPTVTVEDETGVTLEKDTDYTVAYSAGCKYVGTYTVTVTFIGDYSGTEQKTFSIKKQPLSADRVELGGAFGMKLYDGTVNKPSVTVTAAQGTTLTEGGSYTVAYCCEGGCKTAGDHTVTVTGKGNYTGTVKKVFSIISQGLDVDRMVLSSESYTYDGSVKKPTVTVKSSQDATLTEGTDYTVTYCCAAGCKTVGSHTVMVEGQGNYSLGGFKVFNITKQPISADRIVLSAESYTYNGSVRKPTVTVKTSQGTTITKGTSYTVSYCCASGCKTVGTHKVTVTAKGNYTGTVTKTFKITKQPVIAARITLSASSFEYDGAVKKPTVTVKSIQGGTLTEGGSYTVAYCCAGGCKTAGTHKITVTAKGYYTGTVTKTFTVAKQPISADRIVLSAESYTYNGSVRKPTVTVKTSQGTTITKGTSYTVAYCCASGCKTVGTHKVTVTAKGNYTGTVTKTFKMTKQPVIAARITLSASSFEYDGAVKKPTVTVKSIQGGTLTEGGSYTVAYCCAEGCKTVGTHKITVTAKGYYTGTVTKTFTITKQQLSADRITLSSKTYPNDGTVKKPTVTVKTTQGTTLTKGASYTVAYCCADGCKTAGLHKVTVTGKGNYAGTVTKTFTIGK